MQDIQTVLAALELPVSHPPYLGTATEYITYYLIDHGHNNWASGEAIEDVTVWSVDLYTQGNYQTTAAQILSGLRAAGYVVRKGPEMWEDDTRFYHVNFDVRGWTTAPAYAEEDLEEPVEPAEPAEPEEPEETDD